MSLCNSVLINSIRCNRLGQQRLLENRVLDWFGSICKELRIFLTSFISQSRVPYEVAGREHLPIRGDVSTSLSSIIQVLSIALNHTPWQGYCIWRILQEVTSPVFRAECPRKPRGCCLHHPFDAPPPVCLILTIGSPHRRTYGRPCYSSANNLEIRSQKGGTRRSTCEIGGVSAAVALLAFLSMSCGRLGF